MKLTRIHNGLHAMVPCKVNLALKVLRRRSDGFHELETIMMAVALCDELSLLPDRSGTFRLRVTFEDVSRLTTDDPAWDVPSDGKNLVVKACHAIASAMEVSGLGGELHLHKRIPSMAGLGGGSADAAAAIVLGAIACHEANVPNPEAHLWNQSLQRCHQVAAELGSDLNFFLEGHTMLDSWIANCQGRGEKVSPIPAAPDCWLVLVHPPAGCSTKEVFGRLQITEKPQQSIANVIESLRSNQIEKVGGSMFNDLEQAASEVTPLVERSRNWIDRYDHLGQCMSGSGSARFCLCHNQEQAEKIANGVRCNGVRAYVVRPWYQPSVSSQVAAMWVS